MPETRAAKRRKLENPQKKDTKRKKLTPRNKPSTRKKRKLESEQRPKATASEPADEEEILKAFDLETKYGACIGISRMDRWNRAKRFRLNPPDAVRAILEKHGEEDSIQKCLWEGRV